jgi:hypothetical protein
VIEEKSKDDTKSVELVPTEGIDPILLERVVNAIQARPATPQPGQRPGVPTAPARGSPYSSGR